jgi:hypothetical protein
MGRTTQKTCSTAGPLRIIHSPFLYVRAEVPLSSASLPAYARSSALPMPGYPYRGGGGEGTHMARIFFTSVGNCPDLPEPILRPSPAIGHETKILDVYEPSLGYDLEKFPYQPPQRKTRSTSRAGLLRGVCGHMSIYSIVRQCHEAYSILTVQGRPPWISS